MCLSVCNSVVISVEQRRKGVKNLPQTPTGTRTPIDLIFNTMSRIGATIRTSVQRRSKKPEKAQKPHINGINGHARANGNHAMQIEEIHENSAFEISPTKPNRPTTLGQFWKFSEQKMFLKLFENLISFALMPFFYGRKICTKYDALNTYIVSLRASYHSIFIIIDDIVVYIILRISKFPLRIFPFVKPPVTPKTKCPQTVTFL